MQLEQLSDLDELVLRCRSEGAKGHIREAVLAYKAGAYRASIVATWTALVFDFIDKVRELSIAGSAEARTWLTEYEKFQAEFDQGNKDVVRHLLKFENDVLLTARDKFLLLSHSEFIDLERLKDDRNRCAHPSFQRIETPYYPSAEQTRYHIKNAVLYMLAAPPVQGRHALENLKLLVDSEYFPSITDEAVLQLSASDLSRPSDSLLTAFIDYLFFSTIDKNHKLFRKLRAAAAINACITLFHETTIIRLSKHINKFIFQLNDNDFPDLYALICHIDGIYSVLSDASKNKLKTVTKKCGKSVFLDIAGFALKIDELAQISEARIKRLNQGDIKEIKGFHRYKPCVDRAIDLFVNARTWSDTYDVYNDLIKYTIQTVKHEHVAKVIRALGDCSEKIPKKSGYYSFLKRLADDRLDKEKIKQLMHKEGMEAYISNFDFLNA